MRSDGIDGRRDAVGHPPRHPRNDLQEAGQSQQRPHVPERREPLLQIPHEPITPAPPQQAANHRPRAESEKQSVHS
eukprot:747756-Hanusia_phi.AAC.2